MIVEGQAPVQTVANRPVSGVAAMVRAVLDTVSADTLSQLPIALRFWDGSELPSAQPEALGTLIVGNREVLAYLLREPNELGLSRAWVSGSLDFDGDLEAALGLRASLRAMRLTAADRLRLLAAIPRIGGVGVLRRPARLATEPAPRGRRHSLGRDRRAIQHHYELPTSFYRLFLGETMVYSCAYFESEQDTLEEAQTRKLDVICRKLRLQEGDRLLDIGCGWGSLIVHAAVRYGVRALGVTLSPRQAQTANELAQEAGVADRCEAHVADYRELGAQQFDAIASVGMYEHVGRAQLGTYARAVRELLRPGGLFLNHGIARVTPVHDSDKTLISRFVFPDGELHVLTDVMRELERTGLEVRDVESLREHYALTLRHWVRNLAAMRDAAIREVGAERERIWRLYMTGSASAFALGEVSVFQTLALKHGRPHRLPLSRPRPV